MLLRSLCTVLFLAPIFSFTQNTVKEKVDVNKIQFGGVYKNTLSINLGGTSAAAGISFEHLISKNLMIDIGIGYVGGGIGLKIYPWAVKRGTLRSNFILSSTYYAWPKAAKFQGFYGGFGFTYFAVSTKLNLHVDIGPSYFYHYPEAVIQFPDRFFLMGNIKIGRRFSFVAMKKRKSNLKED
ncbi:hypothetical protein JYT74_02915 [Crocinitomix catalasitica]|nr:hypothetical protein [Crocinitomix catalasitica]